MLEYSRNLWCLYRPFIRDQKQINPYSLLSLSTERICVKPENYRPYLSVNSKQWPLIADVGSKWSSRGLFLRAATPNGPCS